MTLVTIEAPGSEGKVTDRPKTALQIHEAAALVDVVEHDYCIEERRGFSVVGTAAPLASNDVLGIWRAEYQKAAATRTIATVGTNAYTQPASGSGTQIVSGMGSGAIPRCQYRDTTVICSQDRITPCVFYGGRNFRTSTSALSVNTVANEARLNATGGSWSTDADRGAFVEVTNDQLTGRFYLPISERADANNISVEQMKASTAFSQGSIQDVFSFTTSAPCINVYDKGTLSTNAFAYAGSGTKWSTGEIVVVPNTSAPFDDMCLVELADGAKLYGIASVSSDTAMGSFSSMPVDSNINYRILRRAAFPEATTHKESLWGGGMLPFPERLFVFPPGWNPTLPPYFALLPSDENDYNPSLTLVRTNPLDFEPGFIDVPSTGSGDPLEALLSTPGPLLAITKLHAYQVNGTYGGANVGVLSRGAGCLDKRTAISVEVGQFWAGPTGIWWYRNGGLSNLTKDRIQNEWRSWVDGFAEGTDYLCSVVAHGYLVVGGKVGSDSRCYRFNLENGSVANFSNIIPRATHSVRLDGEDEKALFSDTEGSDGDRVFDFAPAVNQTGDANDASGDGPAMQYEGPANLGDFVNIKKPSRLTRMGFHLEAYDSDGPGSDFAVEVGTTGQIDSDGEVVTDTWNIESVNQSGTLHRMRRVGRLGRWHQIRVSKTQTQSTQIKACLQRITVDLRARGREV